MRVVAKGKKLGALVGFTFRQPAIMQALGLANNSRTLGAYLMYEPFSKAWTRTLKPSQTLALCEGGGVMYRHPRVQVTLWLDRYVKDIYPNWVRNGSQLPDLVAIAAERQAGLARALTRPICALAPPVAQSSERQPAPAGPLAKPARAPGGALAFAPARPLTKLIRAPVRALPPAPPRALTKPVRVLALPAAPIAQSSRGKTQPRKTLHKRNLSRSAPQMPKDVTVIDLTEESEEKRVCKRKRSLLAGDAKVTVSVLDRERGTQAKRRRLSKAMLKGTGTEEDPYVL